MLVDSEPLKKIKAWAESYSKEIHAQDSRLRHKIQIVHEDGSIFILMNSFIEKKGDWIVVFSEHYDTLFFDKDDLVICQEDEMKYIKTSEILDR